MTMHLTASVSAQPTEMARGEVSFVRPKVVLGVQVWVGVAQRLDLRISSRLGENGRCGNLRDRRVRLWNALKWYVAPRSKERAVDDNVGGHAMRVGKGVQRAFEDQPTSLRHSVRVDF